MPLGNIIRVEGGNEKGMCAEPKSANAAHDNASQIVGMETIWRGKGENPHPYTGENFDGSNPHPQQMNPCNTCADKDNAEEYMKYANANTK